MFSAASYILNHSFSSLSPVMNTASMACEVNGSATNCPMWLGGFFFGFQIVWLLVVVLLIVSMWKIYQKAGQPGWAAIVPIYNYYVLLVIVRKPAWWLLLYFIPFVNIIIGFIVLNELSKAFGKGIGYTLGLIFLPFIFYPMLAFGKSTYSVVLPAMPQAAM